MENQALGMIETIGLVGLIEAADAAAKAAKVVIVDYEQAEGGLVIIKIRGTVAAVKAAVEAGAAACKRVGRLWATHVIPNPDPQIEFMIQRKKPPKNGTEPQPKPEPPQAPPEKPKDETSSPFYLSKMEGLEDIIDKVKNYGLDYLTTNEIRRLVRSIKEFPYPPGISGKMKREELLNEISKRGVVVPGIEKPIFPSGEGFERRIKPEEKEKEEDNSPFFLEPQKGEEKIVQTLLIQGIEALHIKQLQHLAKRFKNFPVLRIDQASRETLINGFKRGIIIKGHEDKIIKPMD